MRSPVPLGVFLSMISAPAYGGDEGPGTPAALFRPPPALAGDLGAYRSVLAFDDGRPVRSAADWAERRREILKTWHGFLGPWPPRMARPEVTESGRDARQGFTERRVKVGVAPDRTVEGYLLVPGGEGPFPAVLIVFYEPETAVGRGKPQLDFADRLVRRGFVALSIGFDPRVIEPVAGAPPLQPLSYLAYVAANARTALASLPEVDGRRVGILGHSYGGKWAMFASCLDEGFACGVWSDPGVVFDETRVNVNYWEPWYLGFEAGRKRTPGLPSAENPRTGAYRQLVEAGHDLHELHALMAPRPFLVSGGSEDPPERWRALNHSVAVNALLGQTDRVAMSNRPDHTPTDASNAQIDRFFDHVLKPAKGRGNGPR